MNPVKNGQVWREEIFLDTSQEMFTAWLVAHIRALPKKHYVIDRGFLKLHLARDGPLFLDGTLRDANSQPVRIDGQLELIHDAVIPNPEVYTPIEPSGGLGEPFEIDPADVSMPIDLVTSLIKFDIRPIAPERIQVIASCRLVELREFFYDLLAEVGRVYGIGDQHVKPRGDHPSKVGRPRLTEADWEQRFQKVREVQRKSEDLGITLEQACARIGVSYSTFRDWRRKMTE